MAKDRRKNLFGQLLLFSATLAWGISFTVLQDVIDSVSLYYVIGVRFLISALLLALIFIPHFKNMNKGTFIRGTILGLILTIAYLTQTYGLQNTTPGENAFLTSTYNIMCPFLLWAIYKVLPKIYNLIAAVLCVVGVALIALANGGVNNGDPFLGYSLTLVAALFFAFQILAINNARKKGDDACMTLFLEIAVVGIVFSIMSLIIDLPKGIDVYSLDTKQLIMVLVLTLVSTFYAQFAQIQGMQYTHANQAAIILSLESVFGTLFSVIMGKEKTSFMMYVGFGIILIAMIISELKLDPRKLFKTPKKKL